MVTAIVKSNKSSEAVKYQKNENIKAENIMPAEEFDLNLHPLRNESEHACGIYMTMLLTVAFCDSGNELSENENRWLKVLFKAAGVEGEISKYIKAAHNIDETEIERFTKTFSKTEIIQKAKAKSQNNQNKNNKSNDDDEMKSSDIALHFIIDALVLSACDGNINEDEAELISKYAYFLGLKDDEFKFACEIALAVAEQDNQKYYETVDNKKPVFVDTMVFGYYFKSGRIICDENTELWTGKFTITDNIKTIRKNLIIKNADITIADGVTANLIADESITIVNSVIRTNDYMAFTSKNISASDGSKFIGFKKDILVFDAQNKIEIKNCVFETAKKVRCINATNFICYKSKFTGGESLDCESIGINGKFEISECEFKNIIKPLFIDNYESQGSNIKILNSKFINCNNGAIIVKQCDVHNSPGYDSGYISGCEFKNCNKAIIEESKNGTGSQNFFITSNDFINCGNKYITKSIKAVESDNQVS